MGRDGPGEVRDRCRGWGQGHTHAFRPQSWDQWARPHLSRRCVLCSSRYTSPFTGTWIPASCLRGDGQSLATWFSPSPASPHVARGLVRTPGDVPRPRRSGEAQLWGALSRGWVSGICHPRVMMAVGRPLCACAAAAPRRVPVL